MKRIVLVFLLLVGPAIAQDEEQEFQIISKSQAKSLERYISNLKADNERLEQKLKDINIKLGCI